MSAVARGAARLVAMAFVTVGVAVTMLVWADDE